MSPFSTHVFADAVQASRFVADKLDRLIRQRQTAGQATVLGLATGSTPVLLYGELIRRHREDGLDLARVVTFNLDEYYPMPGDDPHSYRRWMRETFFAHVNIPEAQIHIPDGGVPEDAVVEHCREYEQAIRRHGGVDVQILGIGRNGHIGFNEPGSPPDSRTRLVTLDTVTREDASAGFGGLDRVPRFALTMGVGTILEARQIVLLAFGASKAAIVREAFHGPISERVPASWLRTHGHVTVILDEASASGAETLA